MERKKHRITEVDEDLGIIDNVLKEHGMDKKTAEQCLHDQLKAYGFNGLAEAIESTGSASLKQTIYEAMEAYAEQYKPLWLKVEERQPEFGEKVLTLRNENILMGRCYANGWTIFYVNGEQFTNESIPTHWTELPPLPQKD